MNKNSFIENFADLFEETDASAFTPETRFKDLEEWSSLVALSIIAMVDDEYEVELKGDDIRNSDTINDLFNIVSSRV